MRYKKSVYNIVVEMREDAKVLMFNTASGILSLIDQQTQNIYSKVESIEYESLDLSIKEILEKLIQANYIVDRDIDEISVVKVRRQMKKYDMSIFNLTIAPTLGCNMACPYCYENKNTYIMDESTQCSVISFIKALYSRSPFKTLNVTWYGGEPLTAKEVLFNLSTMMIAMCDEMGIAYTSSMITNGTLLDYATAKQLVDYHKLKTVQITIDGMAKVHNQRRILLDGSDSFGTIIKNIEDIKGLVKIAVRVNVDKCNLGEMPLMIDYFFNQLKWGTNPKVYFAPIVDYNNNCKTEGLVCISTEDFAELEYNWAKLIYRINRNAIVDQLFPKPRTISCGAEMKNNYVIDPKGNLYHCWLHIGDQNHKSGHVNFPYCISKEDSKWLLTELSEHCYECKFLPICQGGCAYYRICNNETFRCTRSKFNYKKVLQLACKDYLNQKEVNCNGQL